MPFGPNKIILKNILFVLGRQPPLPPVDQGLLINEVSRSHKTTHHSRQDSSGRVITSSQRPLPDNTKQSRHASGGIRTHNLSRRAAVDLRLSPRGHWDRSFENHNSSKRGWQHFVKMCSGINGSATLDATRTSLIFLVFLVQQTRNELVSKSTTKYYAVALFNTHFCVRVRLKPDGTR